MEPYSPKIGDITYMSELTPHPAPFITQIVQQLGEGSNSQTAFVLQFTSLTLRKLSAHWRKTMNPVTRCCTVTGIKGGV
jgi:hypothetical protein